MEWERRLIKCFNENQLNLALKKIKRLENLPKCLQKLYCSSNQISRLENLPNRLRILWCDSNQITRLENLPNCLQELDCGNNHITKIENLPISLETLYYDRNPIQFVDNVDINRVNFSLRGYQAIRRIQRRMKRRFKLKNDASRIIGRQALHWLHRVDGIMVKKGWDELVNSGLVNSFVGKK